MAAKHGNFEFPSDWQGASRGSYLATAAAGFVIVAGVSAWFLYSAFRIEVPSRHVAVMIRNTGSDLPNELELVPAGEEYEGVKGVRVEVLREGRYFRNPYVWNWQIFPQIEVPQGKLGVAIRLFGDDLPRGELLARDAGQKGIVPAALNPGRYAKYSNPFAFGVELHPTITVPAGHKGVVTLVTGKLPVNSNLLLVEDGERGVQRKPLDPGTYYFNPYEKQVNLVDCRTKKLGLTEEQDMGFPSKDGFWIRLEGTVQFHVIPDKAPDVFVTYNESANGEQIHEDIVRKIIMPTARSFCRLAGSSYTGKQFIEGEAREEFQRSFETKLSEESERKGIRVVSALITKIFPPEKISEPVRAREIAHQQQAQYVQEIKQQESEAKLVTEQKRIEQKKRLIDAEREVIELLTEAEQKQKVEVTEAEQELAVAKKRLEAAQDKAEAILARGKAEADVIKFGNEAEASGLRAAVAAFSGSGYLYAQQVLFGKLAPGFAEIMVNTSDSPIMRIFDRFQDEAPRSGGQIGVGARSEQPPILESTVGARQ